MWITSPTTTWTAMLGTLAFIGIIAISAAGFLFTYAPFMGVTFATRAVSLLDEIATAGSARPPPK